MRSDAEIQRIISGVQKRLEERRKLGGLSLRVPANGYSQSDDWLTLVVTPLDPSIRAYDYVRQLSEVETELRKEGTQRVVLVPALAD